MTALALAVLASYGVFLIYTSVALGWTGLQPGPAPVRRQTSRRTLDDRLAGAGLGSVRPPQLLAVMTALFVVGFVITFAIFGGLVPALIVGLFASSFPVATRRMRRAAARAAAMEAWPRMLEEIRILTSTVGRSIPQALFEVGRRAPVELRAAFEAAHREWLLTTDFASAVSVLKAALGDPTADAACETLLVAHQVGGSDLDRRLEALIEDRIQDTQGRKDARAKQAGARFARRFVLIVPVGMAAAGMSVGSGRDAYQTPLGQALVVAAIGSVIACWVWAGRIMRIPEEERVFDG
jgi:tight adherence protein B